MAAIVANSTEVKLDDYTAANEQQLGSILNDKQREPDFDDSGNERAASASEFVAPGNSA